MSFTSSAALSSALDLAVLDGALRVRVGFAFVSVALSDFAFAFVLLGAFRFRLVDAFESVLTSGVSSDVASVFGLRPGALRRALDREIGFLSELSSVGASSATSTSFVFLGAARRPERDRFSEPASESVSASLDFDLRLPLRLGLSSSAISGVFASLSPFGSITAKASAVIVSSLSSLERFSSRRERPRPRPPRRPRRDRRRDERRFSSSDSSLSSSELARSSSSFALSFSAFLAFLEVLRFAASFSFLKSCSILTSGSLRLSVRFSTTSSSNCGRINESSPTTSVKTSVIWSTCVNRSRFSFSR